LRSCAEEEISVPPPSFAPPLAGFGSFKIPSTNSISNVYIKQFITQKKWGRNQFKWKSNNYKKQNLEYYSILYS